MLNGTVKLSLTNTGSIHRPNQDNAHYGRVAIITPWFRNLLGVDDMLHLLEHYHIQERSGVTLSVRDAWKRHQVQMWLAAHGRIYASGCFCEDCWAFWESWLSIEWEA